MPLLREGLHAMLSLSGWIGAPSATGLTSSAKRHLTEAAGQPLSSDAPGVPPVLAGDAWVFVGPSVARVGDVAAVIRGTPAWDTSDGRITRARSHAHAVIEAYRLHGKRFLELLQGSFAVVVMDGAARAAILAVDRMGIERLAFRRTDEGLTFSSSAEAAARAFGRAPRIAHQSLLSYVFFHMIPSPQTVFEATQKIPPATAVFVEDDRLWQETYWQPRFAEPRRKGSDAPERSLHAALEAGVRAAQPDDATGAFLSGGLDSSTVAGYLSKVTARPARTFSIGFGLEDYDELRYARIAAAHFGFDARYYTVGPDDIVDLLPRIARAYDEPFGNASALPTYCCARLARESGMTHLLAGDGGDELFAGNKRYAEQMVFERYKLVPGLFRTRLLEPMLDRMPVRLTNRLVRKARGYVAQANTPLPDRLESWNFLHRLGSEMVLHPDLLDVIDTSAPLQHMRRVYSSSPAVALIDHMLHYDWRFTLADNDLRKVGTMCELAGVRVSYPMLHRDVIELSTRVPAGLKMRGTDLRTFYKRSMATFLPREIIQKTKHGFGLPFGLWLQRSSRLAEMIETSLAGLRARRVIRAEFIDRLRQLHGEEDASYYGVLVWTFAMLEQWFQEHRVAP
ncbi:MAG: asparagine synthase [Gammaproteobacteria bacterium]